MMDVRISLAPAGDLRLHLPSGRTLDISGEHGLRYVKQILRDAEAGREKPGYIRAFPTQAVVDTWLKQDMEAKHEAARERRLAEAAAFEREHGFSLDKLEIDL